MAEGIDRDWRAMFRFADDIRHYCDNIKKVCGDLRSNMDSARPLMRDEVSQRALNKIEAFANGLISGLPEAQRAENKLRKSAELLRAAEVLGNGI